MGRTSHTVKKKQKTIWAFEEDLPEITAFVKKKNVLREAMIYGKNKVQRSND